MFDDSPSVALLTPRGRGAVATILLHRAEALLDEGTPPLFRAANGRAVAQQTINRIVFGRFGDSPAEEVVLCRLDDRTVELHCHGGNAAVDRVVGELTSRGALLLPADELETDLRGVLDAECRFALARASTLRTANHLLTQCHGALRCFVEQTLFLPTGDLARPAQALDEILRWTEFGRHLIEPWQVVLVGRPNVGKSSLINALLGYDRSIVYDQPGTTRDVVTGETAFDGWPVQLADTAGLRTTAGTLESQGIERAREYGQSADLVLLLIDRSQPPHVDDQNLLSEYPDCLIVANKCDLPDAWGPELPATAISISALGSRGLDRLTAAIITRLIPKVPAVESPLPVTPRQCALLLAARTALEQGKLDGAREALQELLQPRLAGNAADPIRRCRPSGGLVRSTGE